MSISYFGDGSCHTSYGGSFSNGGTTYPGAAAQHYQNLYNQQNAMTAAAYNTKPPESNNNYYTSTTSGWGPSYESSSPKTVNYKSTITYNPRYGPPTFIGEIQKRKNTRIAQQEEETSLFNRYTKLIKSYGEKRGTQIFKIERYGFLDFIRGDSYMDLDIKRIKEVPKICEKCQTILLKGTDICWKCSYEGDMEFYEYRGYKAADERELAYRERETAYMLGHTNYI